MSNQYAKQDQNKFPALLGHSGTGDASETRRVVVENGAAYVQLTEGGNENLAFRIDEADGSTTYLGYATIGSNETAPVWRIKKIIEGTSITSLLWADGDDDFNNVWSNRAAGTYV